MRAKNSSSLLPSRNDRLGERPDRPPAHEGSGSVRSTFELLIDCEEERVLRAMLVGMLREADH